MLPRKTTDPSLAWKFEDMDGKMTDVAGTWGDEPLYYDLNVEPLLNQKDFKAEVDMKLHDVIVVHKMHVITTWTGKTFIGMPQKKNNASGERMDIAHAANAGFKKELEDAIMAEYQKKQEMKKDKKPAAR